MRVATWNVNSIRMRTAHVGRWLERHQPDLLLLQEIKTESFPGAAFEPFGYRSEAVGQKTYNGVAVLGRGDFAVTERRLPGLPEDDAQARYIEVEAQGVRVGNLYLPNGNSGGEAGYQYKLRWMECLAAHAERLLAADVPLVLAGDYNVCPADEDFSPGTIGPTDALVRPPTRALFRRLLWAGLTDAVRALHPRETVWTFWDYQGGAWSRDKGLRIDHVLLSPTLTERLVSVRPDRDARAEEQPSDHVPVMLELG